ncbi:putative 39S ribosomal protein L24, mitochondrial [Porphyridium purpureum]|uniref:Large ribosomal subunit protein uL24c n=1 Tax=Porphyridium purpureum TaxID=35688 RepID=A0A5J4YLF6_PORPP|nr:putative 39S ribosomal protein L24, mitochondrial [Porphyridium purpureum]|eukprot:POR3703..scf244_11
MGLRKQIKFQRRPSLKSGWRNSAPIRGGGATKLASQFGYENTGKMSTEMLYRSQSALEEIRRPPAAKVYHKSWKVLRGDFVQVVDPEHRDVSVRGMVLEVVRQSSCVVVQGVNFQKVRITDPETRRPKVVTTEGPIELDKIAVVDPIEKKPTEVDFEWLEDGTRVRVARLSGAIIPKPELCKKKRYERPVGGVKDTPVEAVIRRTYNPDDDGLVSLLKQLNLDTSMLDGQLTIIYPSKQDDGSNTSGGGS